MDPTAAGKSGLLRYLVEGALDDMEQQEVTGWLWRTQCRRGARRIMTSGAVPVGLMIRPESYCTCREW